MKSRTSVDQWLEQYLPYIIGMVFGLIWTFIFAEKDLPLKVEDLIKSMINVYAVIIGFLATALALLFAIDDRSVIKFLRENFLYKRFVRYFFEAIVCLSIALVFSSLLIVHTFDMSSLLTKALVNIWFAITCISGFVSFRVFWNLFITLHRQIEDDENSTVDPD